MTPDFAVIGRGLMGTACARYLAEAGYAVLLIGPDEPVDRASHDGPFGSFHDAGRITRRIATDPVWAELSRRAIDRYAKIEAASGLRFFTPGMSIMAGGAHGPAAAAMDGVIATAQALALDHEVLRGPDLSLRFPEFGFAPGTTAILDQSGGVVNPRVMRQAFERLAQTAGAQIVARPVAQVNQGQIHLEDGTTLRAGHTVLATGAYASAAPLGPLPDMRAYGRTVVLAELDEAEAARLSPMPSLIFWPERSAHDLYLLPPVRYPDGRTYLKIGGEGDSPVLSTATEARDWFRSGGSAAAAARLEDALRQVLPGTSIKAVRTDSCAVGFTATGQPYIERLDADLTVLTGGNGAGAKCADELGRLGAIAAQSGEPDAQIVGADFRVRFRRAP